MRERGDDAPGQIAKWYCYVGTRLSDMLYRMGETEKWVLVVDDDEDVRILTVEVLESAGYRAVAVPGGSAALQMMGERAPTLVLSDLMMSDMDGRTFLSGARRLFGVSTPPFVFVTAVEPCDRLDITEQVLSKPYEVADLLGVVEPHLRT